MEIPAIVAMAGKLRVRRVTLFPVVAQRENKLHIERERPLIGPVLADATQIAREWEIELRVGASLDEEHINVDALPTQCLHPWSYTYISCTGAVGYCDHLVGHESLTLGQIRTGTFSSVWNNGLFQALRAEHRDRHPSNGCQTFKHCNWCYRRRYVDFEDDILPTSIERVVGTRGHNPCKTSTHTSPVRDDFLDGGGYEG